MNTYFKLSVLISFFLFTQVYQYVDFTPSLGLTIFISLVLIAIGLNMIATGLTWGKGE
jgi:hypothetical protein